MQEIATPQNTPTIAQEDYDQYLPGSAEKKRALLMYLLIGIIGALGTSQPKSVYERYHIQQAIGRRTVCLACVVVSLVLLFIPIVRYLPIVVYIGLIVVLGVCIKQVSDGKYMRDSKNVLSVFAGLGGWICDLFGIKI